MDEPTEIELKLETDSQALADATLLEGEGETLLPLMKRIAELPGPLVLTQAASTAALKKDPDAICLAWLLEEVSTSVNTASHC